MKKNLIPFILLFGTLQAQGQSFQWAKTYSGTNSQLIETITHDSSGNVYTAGEYLTDINGN
ncbi:MAG TPA: hypothetical protein VK177_09150, partial [Flavobacteriales bacterium]|nr:hypothetical protein [Flavobacteriales bacterium]